MNPAQGRSELRKALRASWKLFGTTFVFSFFVNALMLTGPIYMLQVYDRVLGSRSEETLLALSILVAFLYLMMGFLDYARGRVLARAGAVFQTLLDHRVFTTVLRQAGLSAGRLGPNTGLRDLEAVQRLFSSPAMFAVFDIPWTPVFLLAIFIFHPWLGYLAVGGGTFLIMITFLNQWMTKRVVAEANMATAQADLFADAVRNEAELVQSLGMRAAVFDRWMRYRELSLSRTMSSSDRTGTFSSATKTIRLFLQSAMLGLGAYLVLQGEMTAGAMIAGSILLGRALAPVEQAIGQWPLVQRAQTGWQRLSELLEKSPFEEPKTQLPPPRAILDVQQLTVIPPGDKHAALRMMSFRLEPGKALGVIGQSGAGKSTLARALTGVWPAAGGKIRLDGASTDQYEPDVLGSYIGYLPQRVTLFEGTIAENIARMSTEPDAKKVIEAAKKAGAHDVIVRLPDGYDTRVTAHGGRLSGGQVQRIGLARAMYGNPVLLVLDEPNSNLDSIGSDALNAAIREMKSQGQSVIIMAHRPAAIAECELLLVIEDGLAKAFGPRDEVLQKQVQNHGQVNKSIAAGAKSGATS
ncbi:MAG: type I secretion system permease/ATPase [Alphaproteobacteria bacterium]|nr:type I secretion system permease/ATPase [Alphaproteobacteria bacterium]